ncbi:MAG: shikimate kinase [Pirellulales bacterium]
MPANVFLIGYRGTGKTTVAQRLALKLGWEWVDADVEVELCAGKSVAEIFAQEAEPAFRDLEESVVAKLCQRAAQVVALGGGAILRPSTRERIGQAGFVVWLTATPATIAERLAADATTATRRPNLTPLSGLAEIEQVLRERSPIYQACADLTIDTETRSPQDVADEIAAHLRPAM